jgi:hypothetical protein
MKNPIESCIYNIVYSYLIVDMNDDQHKTKAKKTSKLITESIINYVKSYEKRNGDVIKI